LQLTSFRHITIIQTAFLGDVALALHLARRIKLLHRNCTLSFVCLPSARKLAESSPSIDTVISFDKRGKHSGLKGIRRLAQILNKQETECVLGLQRSARTSLVAYLSKARVRIGFKNSTLSSLYTHTADWDINCHEVERNSSLLRFFSDNQYQAERTELPLVEIHDSDKTIIESAIQSAKELHKGVYSSRIICIAPGSIWYTKRWTQEGFSVVASQLRECGYTVIFIGGDEDRFLCEELARTSETISLAGKTSLPQTLALLSRTELLLANDSAPTHLAGLVGCTTATIYGSTLPSFGFAPRGEHDIIIENTAVPCRSCGLHGKKECPKGTLECMTSIKPDYVTTTLLNKLQHK
jgi:heptosyltransferase II